MCTSISTGISGIVLTAVFLAPLSWAQADLIPVGPFTGQLSESWESFATSPPEGPYLPSPSTIMGGAATISGAQMAVFQPGVFDWSLGSSGYAQTANGTRAFGAGGAGDQTTTILFATPVSDFGGYWGAFTSVYDGDPALIAISFYDATDALLATQVASYSRPSDGVLEWHGWSSTVPIKRISFVEHRVAVDSMQASPVPEPTSLLLFAITCLVLSAKPRS